jgi:2-methylcitrate dehydratase PrpD
MKLDQFVADAIVPKRARARALDAIVDTIGVALAGSREVCARTVQTVVAAEGGDACTVLGTGLRSSATGAALANATAAHALDFDDMCFVSLAHPSAPLMAAILAAGEAVAASWGAVLDAYAIGFEVEARLGRAMNPAHYERGWHCTSTIGSIGAAAASCRLLALDAAQAGHALAIAASSACGLKENFGTMVKPLHAGMAARNGVYAALLAQAGMTASETALEGAQGLLRAMDAAMPTLQPACADLGERWELLESGITVKLYPSCAATHPALDVVLDMLSEQRFSPDDVLSIEVGVDALTPGVLIHARPSSALEAKFSMPFCVAAAVVLGKVDLHTFADARLSDGRIASLMERVFMRVDSALDRALPPLTQARVRVALRDGRVLVRQASGARGYPDRPATPQALDAKFIACARTVFDEKRARETLAQLRAVDPASEVSRSIRALQSQ